MADERKTDRRTLQKLSELAAHHAVQTTGTPEARYWDGVLDGLQQALGDDIFQIQTITSYKLIRTPVAAGSNTTLEEVPNV